MKDGFIQQIGTPQEVCNHPYNLFVAGFIGTNFFDAKLVKQNGRYAVKLANATVGLSEEKQAVPLFLLFVPRGLGKFLKNYDENLY